MIAKFDHSIFDAHFVKNLFQNTETNRQFNATTTLSIAFMFIFLNNKHFLTFLAWVQ